MLPEDDQPVLVYVAAVGSEVFVDKRSGQSIISINTVRRLLYDVSGWYLRYFSFDEEDKRIFEQVTKLGVPVLDFVEVDLSKPVVKGPFFECHVAHVEKFRLVGVHHPVRFPDTPALFLDALTEVSLVGKLDLPQFERMITL